MNWKKEELQKWFYFSNENVTIKYNTRPKRWTNSEFVRRQKPLIPMSFFCCCLSKNIIVCFLYILCYILLNFSWSKDLICYNKCLAFYLAVSCICMSFILCFSTVPRYPNLQHNLPRNVQGLHLGIMLQVRQSVVISPVRSIIHSL